VSDARAQILAGIRKSLRRGPLDAGRARELEARLADHARGLVPARARELSSAALVDLFEQQARGVACSTARVASLDAVPEALRRYLASQNLPAEIEAAPDPLLDLVPWAKAPLVKVAHGKPSGAESVGVTTAGAAIAETGTLMIESGPTSPTTMNFLAETHVVVLPARRVVGAMEDAWARFRAAHGADVAGAAMPRTVNMITGPSRTGDIEQKLEMGAHGPRRVHIILVEDEALA
jgi:L-lactate dehydrogenase complex protein LldG